MCGGRVFRMAELAVLGIRLVMVEVDIFSTVVTVQAAATELDDMLHHELDFCFHMTVETGLLLKIINAANMAGRTIEQVAAVILDVFVEAETGLYKVFELSVSI
jgi:hypothetical protein